MRKVEVSQAQEENIFCRGGVKGQELRSKKCQWQSTRIKDSSKVPHWKTLSCWKKIGFENHQ